MAKCATLPFLAAFSYITFILLGTSFPWDWWQCACVRGGLGGGMIVAKSGLTFVSDHGMKIKNTPIAFQGQRILAELWKPELIYKVTELTAIFKVRNIIFSVRENLENLELCFKHGMS